MKLQCRCSQLTQILKLNSNLPDHSFKDPTPFLLDHVPAAVNNGRISGVTLSEVSQTYHHPCFSTETGVSINHASEIKSKMHNFSCIKSDLANDARILEAGFHSPLGDATTSDLNQMPESVRFHDPDMTFSETINFLDPLSSVQGGTLPMEAEGCSPGAELDSILPGSNDVFWEQFFPVSPLADATEDVDSSSNKDEGLEKSSHMSHLTEQMGSLSAKMEKV